MLAKVIAHAPTRREAALRLALALEGTGIVGVTTNRDFLVNVLRTNSFLDGDTTTDFIERVAPPLARRPDEGEIRRAAIAAVLWRQVTNRQAARTWSFMPSGWRNGRLPPQSVSLQLQGPTDDMRTMEPVRVSYASARDGSFDVDGQRVIVLSASPTFIDVEIDGRRYRGSITLAGDVVSVSGPSAGISFEFLSRFPEPAGDRPAGGLVAPMPGRVLELRAAVGDAVRAGQVLVVMEAMKMEHHLAAATDGTVTAIQVGIGEQVDNGAVLLVVSAEKG